MTTFATPPTTTRTQRTGMPQGTSADRAKQTEIILRRVEGIPALSPLATQLLTASTAASLEVQQVVAVIETDPILSARVLGLCRRAEKGVNARITSVKRAVIMLGLDAVRTAVLSLDAYNAFRPTAGVDEDPLDMPGSAESTFNRAGFWRYSVAVACAAELLAARHAKLNVAAEDAFLGGMMHAIGKLALEFALPRSYARVLHFAQTHGRDADELERAIIGVDSAEAGERLADHWSLPDPVRQVIRFHASESREPGATAVRLVSVVSAARLLVRSLHIGWSGDFSNPADIAILTDKLGIPQHAINQVLSELHVAVADRLSALSGQNTTAGALLVESLRASGHALRSAQQHADQFRRDSNLSHLSQLQTAAEEARQDIAKERAAAVPARRLAAATATVLPKLAPHITLALGAASSLRDRLERERDRAAASEAADNIRAIANLIAELHAAAGEAPQD